MFMFPYGLRCLSKVWCNNVMLDVYHHIIVLLLVLRISRFGLEETFRLGKL